MHLVVAAMCATSCRTYVSPMSDCEADAAALESDSNTEDSTNTSPTLEKKVSMPDAVPVADQMARIRNILQQAICPIPATTPHLVTHTTKVVSAFPVKQML